MAEVDPVTALPDYVRRLEADQLAELSTHLDARISALMSQGVPVPLDQIERHYMTGLLEELLGPDSALKVREWHLGWLDGRLDMLDAEVRKRLLESGVFSTNGPGQ